MIFGIFILFIALCISSVAAFYSISGLTAIFSAVFWPIVIMGGVLEIGKVVTTVWLHRFWEQSPRYLKYYLSVAVVVLMFITSMGIFGFLSKAHLEATSTVGDNSLIVAQLDQQIAAEQNNIKDAQTVIGQLDQQVQQLIANEKISGKNGSVATRKSQKTEREELAAAIKSSNAAIQKFTTEKLPLEQAQLKIEAEVGPIKYIAQLIYGDVIDKTLLERAVRWVIITIVFVFDPLAIMLVLAGVMTLELSKARARDNKIEPPTISLINEPVIVSKPKKTRKPRTTRVEPTLDPITEPVINEPVSEPVIEVVEDTIESSVEEEPNVITDNDVNSNADVLHDVEEINTPSDPISTDEEPDEINITEKKQYKPLTFAAVADDDTKELTSGFGTKFPTNPQRGDIFLRVDTLPSKLYKWNSKNWMEINKDSTDSYVYRDEYIKHLIEKLSTGEYDIDDLNEAEAEQVKAILSNNQ
jgi:hypothetical protein